MSDNIFFETAGNRLYGHAVFTCWGPLTWLSYNRDPWRRNVQHVAAFNEKGVVIGLHAARVEGTTYKSLFTYVSKNCRGQGIATQLWEIGLGLKEIKKVRVYSVSDGGFTLVEALKDRHPELVFESYEDGNRKLRNLKGKK